MNNFEALDWCENNYSKSKYIAEFYNTITSIFYLVSAVLLFRYSYALDRIRNKNYIIIPVSFMFLVGIFSIYYHATLTIVGQFLDEISVSIMFGLMSISYLPAPLLCNVNRIGRNSLLVLFLILSLVLSPIYFYIWLYIVGNKNHPKLMMIFGFLSVVISIIRINLINYHFNGYKNLLYIKIKKYIIYSCILLSISVMFWFLERQCNNNYHKYFHAIWHIGSSIALYLAFMAGILWREIEHNGLEIYNYV